METIPKRIRTTEEYNWNSIASQMPTFVGDKVMRLAIIIFLACTLTVTGLNAQTVKDQVGFTQLDTELGDLRPDGSGLVVAIVEAELGSSSGNQEGNYLPDFNSGQFNGKTMVDGSAGNGLNTGASSHATNVGWRFFGNNVGLAGGIDNITAYAAGDYLVRVLGFGTGTDPLPSSFDISSHSYIANGLTTAEQFALLSRIDFVVNRDNTIVVVGANNGAANATPDLLAPAYNAITVGRTNGSHSQTDTSGYGSPRTKPDIVVPEDTTSNATPYVSSAAGILLDAAQGTNGAENEAIRAMLFAGATKEEFPGWNRTSTRPIDETFGFGELNIYNSYKIFAGGEFNGSTTDPASNIGFFGYDFDTFDGSNDLFYDFELTEPSVISAALTWNAVITDTNASNLFAPTLSVSDLDLRLYDSSGNFLGLLLDDSVSTDYNLEHIYNELEAGQYTLRISGDSAVDFGFAWRIVGIPQVTSVALNAAEAQQSAVETLSVLFDREVAIADGAFSVVQRSTATEETFADVTINLTEQVINNQTQVTVQFDSHVRNTDNALEDGNYQLTVDASLVTNDGVPLSENLVFGDVEADGFFAFYGDSDGNRILNIFDLLAFRQTFGAAAGDANYSFFMDFQANGIVNIFDLLEFRNRFLTTLPFTFGSSVQAGRPVGSKGEAVTKPGSNAVRAQIQPSTQMEPSTPVVTIDLSRSLRSRTRKLR